MTEDQKNEIAKLRNFGMGYRAIAKKLNVPDSTIKSHCHTYNLTSEDITVDTEHCPICGKLLVQIPHTKKKKFCSAKCCKAFWYQTNTSRTCLCCGKAFAPSQKNSKYCCFDCYIKARFYGGKDGKSD